MAMAEEPRDRELDRAIASVGEAAWRVLTGLPTYYGLFPGWRLKIDGIVQGVLTRRLRAPDPAGIGGIGLRTAAEEIAARIATALRMDRAGDEVRMLNEEALAAVEAGIGGWLDAGRPVATPSGSPSRSTAPGAAVPRPSPGTRSCR